MLHSTQHQFPPLYIYYYSQLSTSGYHNTIHMLSTHNLDRASSFCRPVNNMTLYIVTTISRLEDTICSQPDYLAKDSFGISWIHVQYHNSMIRRLQGNKINIDTLWNHVIINSEECITIMILLHLNLTYKFNSIFKIID